MRSRETTLCLLLYFPSDSAGDSSSRKTVLDMYRRLVIVCTNINYFAFHGADFASLEGAKKILIQFVTFPFHYIN